MLAVRQVRQSNGPRPKEPAPLGNQALADMNLDERKPEFQPSAYRSG
jgi:hypothetical protein